MNALLTSSSTLGFAVHPSIEALLPSDARIADVATGNAIWLLDVASSNAGQTWSLYGFDITSEQLPGASHTPINVRFAVCDMKKPFPSEHIAQYDLVHVRLVGIAHQENEWAATLENLRALLKPGGWLQWEEADVRPASVVVKADVQSKTDATQEIMDILLEKTQATLASASPSIRETFIGSNMQGVVHEAYALDRVPGNRALATRSLMGVAHSIVRKEASRDGTTGELRTFEKTLARSNQEVDAGAYVSYRIDLWLGRHGHQP